MPFASAIDFKSAAPCSRSRSLASPAIASGHSDQRAADAGVDDIRRMAGILFPRPPAGDADTGPLVSFARRGIAAHWKASANQSILELAEACDVPVVLVVLDGCLSQLRERSGFGRRRLWTGATRSARRRQPPYLLLTSDE